MISYILLFRASLGVDYIALVLSSNSRSDETEGFRVKLFVWIGVSVTSVEDLTVTV